MLLVNSVVGSLFRFPPLEQPLESLTVSRKGLPHMAHTISDKQKIRLLKKLIRGLRSCLEDSSIDSSACLMGEDVVEGPNTEQEKVWILREYRAGRL